MIADELLDLIDRLAPADARREIARLARELDAEALGTLCAKLFERELWGGEVAVDLAREARLIPALATALTHPDARVRIRAITALPRCADATAETVLDAYARASARERRALLRAVRALHRTDLADALLQAALDSERIEDARTVLPAASPTRAEQHLGTLLPGSARPERIARAHPKASVQILLESLDWTPHEARDATWDRLTPALVAALAEIARRVDARATTPGLLPAILAAVSSHAPREGWTDTHAPLWNALLRADPDQTLPLLARARLHPYRPALPARDIARELIARASDPLHDLLAAQLGEPRPTALATRLLTSAAPEDARAILRTLIERGVALPARGWTGEHLLPAAARMSAAQAGNPESDIAWLPLAAAEERLDARLRSSIAEVRAQAYRELLGAAVLDPGADLSALLHRLDRLGSERGTVRLAALDALCSAPASRLARVTEESLYPLVHAALIAPDRDPGTLSVLARLSIRILTGTDNTSSLGWRMVDAIAKVNPLAFPLDRIANPLRDLLVDRILPRVSSTETLVQLAWETPAHPGLDTALLAAIRATDPDDIFEFSPLIGAWLRDRRTRVVRVRALLDDPRLDRDSLLGQAGVQAVLTHAGSDLLAQVAGAAASEPDTGRSGRWGSSARTLVASAYDATLREAADNEFVRLAALGSLSRIPGHGLATLRQAALAPETLIESDEDDSVIAAERLRGRALALLGARTEDVGADDVLCAILSGDAVEAADPEAADPGANGASANGAGANESGASGAEANRTSANGADANGAGMPAPVSASGALRRVAGSALIRRTGTLTAAHTAELLTRIDAAATGVSTRRFALAALDRAGTADHAARRLSILGPQPHPDLRWRAIDLALAHPEARTERAFVRAELARPHSPEDSEHAGARLAAISSATLSPAARAEALRAAIDVVKTTGVWAPSSLTLIRIWAPHQRDLADTFWHAVARAPEDVPAGAAAVTATLLAAGHTEGAADALLTLARNRGSRLALLQILDPDALVASAPLPDSAVTTLLSIARSLSATGEHARIASRTVWALTAAGTLEPDRVAAALAETLAGRASIAAELVDSAASRALLDHPDRALALADLLSAGDSAAQIVAVDLLAACIAGTRKSDVTIVLLRDVLPRLAPEPRERALDALARATQPGVFAGSNPHLPMRISPGF
ncbi:hypothetical protein D9V34_05000 [Mycetocola lacteus]|uniref:HEAT repeat domain-containing protein n=1 Tax=Mycetocola lacteus TaxID=76637 RepID=A0A3L7AX89_9MICO|nr:hypothetical protein [Mycetocola lacteus]RLP84150.1 hypothetical protein D9V34_05000 [Mycetocola lacteus]